MHTEQPVCAVTGTGVTLLMSMINDQLVVVCLLYDVSETNAIKLIGWSGGGGGAEACRRAGETAAQEPLASCCVIARWSCVVCTHFDLS